MGLFDRLKKVFHHDKKEEAKEEDVQSQDIEESSELETKEDVEAIATTEEQVEPANDVDEVAEVNTDVTDEEDHATVEDTKDIEEALCEEVKETTEIEETEDQVEESVETSNEETGSTNDGETIEDIPKSSIESEEDVVETPEFVEKNDEAKVVDAIQEASKEEPQEEVVKQDVSESHEEVEMDEGDSFSKEKAEKYDKGLAKTRRTFGERLNALFANFRRVDEDFFEELEDTLITSDVGFNTAIRITDELREEVKLKNAKKPQDIQNVIIEKLVDLYDEEGQDEDYHIHMNSNGLTIMLFVGVNGAGKTTTIGKLAHQLKDEGKKVVLAAADTFRAGAINQLVEWGHRSDVEVVRGAEGSDPASVVFDAIKRAHETDADVLLVDTAGRLQNKVNLMNELEKIKRIIQREEPEAPQEVLLVLDATTGQNAMSQAKQFKETTDVTGLVLTKLDGTAKGGIILAIRNELHIPVKYVGLGEKIDDLEVFDPTQFVYGLFKDLWKEN